MSITVVKEDAAVRLRIEGDLLAADESELTQAVLGHLARGERVFLADFAGAGRVDTAGLGALLAASEHVWRRAGDVWLENADSEVRILFALMRAGEITPGEGIEVLRARGPDGGPPDAVGRGAPLRPRAPGPLRGVEEAAIPEDGPPTA